MENHYDNRREASIRQRLQGEEKEGGNAAGFNAAMESAAHGDRLGRFNARQGHGYAAEQVNDLIDNLSGSGVLRTMLQGKLQEAERLYIAYQLDEARGLFEELAQAGNARAMYVLGRYYHDSNWGWKGADSGDVLAELYVAESREDDEQKTAMLEELFPRVYELAEQGDVFACHEVARMFWHGRGTRGDEQKAIYYWRTAAGAGFWDSMRELGDRFEEQGNYKKAAEWFKKLAEAGCDEGWFGLGWIYKEGEGGIVCVKEAIYCCQKAYEMQGIWAGEAANMIGCILAEHENYKEANAWFRKSGEAGSDWGWYHLAVSYDHGNGLRSDKEQAKEYYLKAYEMQGDCAGDAALAIGMAFDENEEYTKAYEWFQKAAEAGSDWGYFKLGICCLEGKVVTESSIKSLECFTKAYKMNGDAADAAKAVMDAIR